MIAYELCWKLRKRQYLGKKEGRASVTDWWIFFFTCTTSAKFVKVVVPGGISCDGNWSSVQAVDCTYSAPDESNARGPDMENPSLKLILDTAACELKVLKRFWPA